MRTRTLVALTLAIAGSLASPAYADPPPLPLGKIVVIEETSFTGKPLSVHADRSDVVVKLDDQEGCSKFFHIQRTNTNFKELTAVALTAFSAVKRLTFFFDGILQASCNPNVEPIVTHGYVHF